MLDSDLRGGVALTIQVTLGIRHIGAMLLKPSNVFVLTSSAPRLHNQRIFGRESGKIRDRHPILASNQGVLTFARRISAPPLCNLSAPSLTEMQKLAASKPCCNGTVRIFSLLLREVSVRLSMQFRYVPIGLFPKTPRKALLRTVMGLREIKLLHRQDA